jgi:hypothetical protein
MTKTKEEMQRIYSRLRGDLIAIGRLDDDSPELDLTWQALQRAEAESNEAVIAACCRRIVTERLGRAEHADPDDWTLIKSFAER